MQAKDILPQVLTPENIDFFTRPQSRVPDSGWHFDQVIMGDEDLIAIGADLEIGTLLNAYSHGLFPMPMRGSKIGWWSPTTRGIFPLDTFHISRSLQKSCRQFTYRVNTCFADVMAACGHHDRPHGWINNEFILAYTQLHISGWAHSVEVFLDDKLVGGIYGVQIHGLFAGESMFHTHTDASKAALVALVALLTTAGMALFDVQWSTPHLISLGAVDVSRSTYLRMLTEAQNGLSIRQTEHYG